MNIRPKINANLELKKTTKSKKNLLKILTTKLKLYLNTTVPYSYYQILKILFKDYYNIEYIFKIPTKNYLYSKRELS